MLSVLGGPAAVRRCHPPHREPLRARQHRRLPEHAPRRGGRVARRDRPTDAAGPLLADAQSHRRPGFLRACDRGAARRRDRGDGGSALLRLRVAERPARRDRRLAARARLRTQLGLDAVRARSRAAAGRDVARADRVGPERGDEFGGRSCVPSSACRKDSYRSARLSPANPAGTAGWRLADDGEPAARSRPLRRRSRRLPRPRRHGPRAARTAARRSALLAVPHRAPPAELGCNAVFTETGEQLPDRPSSSYRNIVRAGFEELYVLPNWLSPAP